MELLIANFDNLVYSVISLLYLDLFLMNKDEFVKRFEKLKQKLSENYVDKLGEDLSLMDVMYED
mgnify:CR=1 FL=1